MSEGSKTNGRESGDGRAAASGPGADSERRGRPAVCLHGRASAAVWWSTKGRRGVLLECSLVAWAAFRLGFDLSLPSALRSGLVAAEAFVLVIPVTLLVVVVTRAMEAGVADPVDEFARLAD